MDPLISHIVRTLDEVNLRLVKLEGNLVCEILKAKSDLSVASVKIGTGLVMLAHFIALLFILSAVWLSRDQFIELHRGPVIQCSHMNFIGRDSRAEERLAEAFLQSRRLKSDPPKTPGLALHSIAYTNGINSAP